MPDTYNFPTDAVPAASGIAPEVFQKILQAPIVVKIVPPGDPRPRGEWCMQERRADKGRTERMLYLYRPDGGRVSTTVAVGSADWETRAQYRAQAVILVARDALLARIAPEMVKVGDLLVEYITAAAGRAKRGEIKPGSLDNYKNRVGRLGDCLGEAALDTIGPDFPDAYFAWAEANGIEYNTSIDDLLLLRRGVNEALTRKKCGYRVAFRVPPRRPSRGRPFTPSEFDRVLLACLGFVFLDADTLATEIDPETGEARPVRLSPAEIARRLPFYIALLLDVTTGTRKMATLDLTWVDIGGPYIDLIEGVLYREGSSGPRARNKRRGVARLAPGLVETLIPIARADIEAGCIHVIHDERGAPLKNLNCGTWHEILKDACVDDRPYHSAKHTAAQVARHEKISVNDTAEYMRTTPKTLFEIYGMDGDIGLQKDVAEAMWDRSRWRANHAENDARAATAAAARAARAARAVPGRAPSASRDGAAPPPVAAAKVSIAGLLARAPETFVETQTAMLANPPLRRRGRPRRR